MLQPLLAHPLLRPALAALLLLLTMQALRSHWQGSSSRPPKPGHGGLESSDKGRPKLVVAHFMLGNTYPFTEDDWLESFDLAIGTNIDAFALNLGPEPWQHAQALTAFRLLTSHPRLLANFKLFLSLDMNVLPHASAEERAEVVRKVQECVERGGEGYLSWGGGKVLSTFGGGEVRWEGEDGILGGLKRETREKIFFWPTFFLPPDDFINTPYVDGTFAWNTAWPMGNHSISLKEDEPFLYSHKPYMAAVSPLFFTHYGTTGQWAWNKNWIYRSDDLLLPTRFSQLLSLPPARQPDIIQVISWNDYGESHAIAPVRGAQPGSESWTDGMSHEGFRELVAYFAARFKGLQLEAEGEGRVRVWMWYRVQSKDARVEGDEVGRPGNADWAQDLINVFAVSPRSGLTLDLRNGGQRHAIPLGKGETARTVASVPGPVEFVVRDEKQGREVLSGVGREIRDEAEKWNFNMWSGYWASDR